MNIFRNLFLCTVLVLIGCDQSKEIIKETRYVKDPPANEYGGVDSGGGAGKEGKPLESYIVDISQQASFQAILRPLVDKLKQKAPRFAADILHVTIERSWFVIPGPLSEIQGQIMGIEFINFDQLAIQTATEIFLDQKFFQQMGEKDQALLMLHELIMGVRLLEYSNDLDLCLVDTKIFLVNENYSQYTAKRKECLDKFPAYSFSAGFSKFNLTDHDYANVRAIVGKLAKDSDILSGEELMKMAEIYLRRKYLK